MPEYGKHFRQITPYTPGLQPAETERLIKLNTNEHPYPPSPAVRQFLKQADAKRLRLYPSPEGEPLKRALADYYHLPESKVFLGNGSDEVLALAFLAFFADGQPIAFPDVTYSFYEVWATLFRIPFVKKNLQSDWHIAPDDYHDAKGGIVFPNPNAPTGVYETIDTVERIVKENADRVVIVDEAYIDFAGESALSLIDKYEHLLIVRTFSKSRALAGVRIGFAAGSETLIAQLNNIKNAFNSYTMNRLSIGAGVASLKDEAYFQEMTDRVIATRERLARGLSALEFEGPPSGANFLFVRHPRMSAKALYDMLVAEGIYVRHFDTERTRDYLRITVGTDAETDALLKKLNEYLREHDRALHGE